MKTIATVSPDVKLLGFISGVLASLYLTHGFEQEILPNGSLRINVIIEDKNADKGSRAIRNMLCNYDKRVFKTLFSMTYSDN